MKNIIVVTGGAGFVGSNLIRLFLNKTKGFQTPFALLKSLLI